jgi:Cu+-exporting ATPase
VVADSERYRTALRAAHLAVRLPPHTADTRRPALTSVHRDLGPVVEALRLTRRTAAVARANLAGSLTCTAVLLPLTVTGLLGPALSAAATAVCGAALVANSLRLQRPAATHG